MRQVSPKLKPWLDDFNVLVAKLVEGGFKPTSTNAREGLANLTKGLVTEIPDVAWIQDDLIAGENYQVPVRIYHPAPDQALPVLVYFHGGGHMGGSVTVYDPICRKMALATKHVVVSVDYRLTPECPYPAGIVDAYSAVKNLWPTLDGRGIKYTPRLSVAGDSAGGALTATVTAKAQFDEQVQIHKQVMVYPSLDYTMDSESMEQNATGYLLQKGKIAWYFDNYFLGNEDRRAASPLYQAFTDGLPETLMITAEFCPLRDEGVRYAQLAKQAGVKVEQMHFDDMIHTFMNMEDLVQEECQQLYRRIGEFLNQE